MRVCIVRQIRNKINEIFAYFLITSFCFSFKLFFYSGLSNISHCNLNPNTQSYPFLHTVTELNVWYDIKNQRDINMHGNQSVLRL